MRDGVRDRVNAPIDSKLKKMFENLHETHRKSWTEVFEKAVREILIEVDPVQALEYEIKLLEEKLDEKRKALMRTKNDVSILEIEELDQERSLKEKEEKLQRIRIQKISTDFKIYHEQWKHGSDHVNWTRIIDFGEFHDIRDAKKWLEKELKARGIMEKHVHYQ